MSNHPVTHATFTLERDYPASPTEVFAAWADEQAKSRWFGAGNEHHLDFRVGGQEVVRARRDDGVTLLAESRYQDIVTDQRIVYSTTLYEGGAPVTLSITSVCLTATAGGTSLVLTEQGTFLDGREEPAWRERGTADQLAALAAELKE